MRARRLTILLLTAGLSAQAQGTYWVAADGSDATGDGSEAKPWATISYAAEHIPDNGSTVLVRDGVYRGRVRLNRRFSQRATFRAQNPCRAQLVHTTESVVTVYGGANIEINGFEVTRPSPTPTAPLVMQVQQQNGFPAEDIVIRNNILHDSYDNDLLKVNNISRRVLVEGNIFYNQQGSDEHIDVNGATDVTIRDNIFFNDFAGSGRTDNDTSSFVVIKNSAGLPENKRIRVQRNVFLNWEGSSGGYFVLVGEDGKPFHEAEDVLIENNLMIGNSPARMRAPFGVKGAKDITFRNNTITGNLPANAFAARLNREVANPVNERIYLFNNVWSDPTGTMEDFSDGEPAETSDARLVNNLYWNAGQPIPADSEVLNHTNDSRAVLGDPKLPAQAGLVLPRWKGDRFLSGNVTIREEFERLITLYGAPGPGSAVIGGSDPSQTPTDDILGRPRDNSPDLGAFEVNERSPEVHAVTDSASFRARLAPGALGTVWGEHLSEVQARSYSTVVPRKLVGVEVLVNDLPAPLWYVAPGQINFQLPYGAAKEHKVTVVRTGFAGSPTGYEFGLSAPAIFPAGDVAAVTHHATGAVVTSQDPARGGEFITIWANGLGALREPLPDGEGASTPIDSEAPVTVLFNGAAVTPAYAGASIGFAGLNQINVQVPQDLSGAVRLEVRAGEATSQAVTVAIAP